MKQIKFLGVSLLVALIAGTGFHGAQNNADFLSNSINPQYALRANEYPDGITEDLNEYLPEDSLTREKEDYFCADLSKSSVMEDSQSVELRLYSSVSTFKGPAGDCYVGVVDYEGHDDQLGSEAVHYNSEDPEADNYVGKIPHVHGSVMEIKVPKSGVVLVPQSIKYTDRLVIDVTSIGSNVFNSNSKFERLENIYIPETIEFIADDAFAFPKDRNGKIIENKEFVVHCQRDKEFPYPDGFMPEGHTVDIDYSYQFSEEQAEGLNVPHSGAFKPIEGNKNFLVGKKNVETNEIESMQVSYILNKADGSKVRLKMPVTMGSKITQSDDEKHEFEILGKRGINNLTFNVDIPLKKGESIDDESIMLSNIYRFDTIDPTTKFPVYDETKPMWSKLKITYAKKEFFSDYVTSYKYVGCSSFNNYTTISFDMEFSQEEYISMKQSVYNANKKHIENGEYSIRFRFINVERLRYDFEYFGEDGSIKHVEAQVPLKVVKFTVGEKRGRTTMLIDNRYVAPDFSAKKIKSFTLKNIYLYMDIYIKDSGAVVVNSPAYTRFSHLNVIPKGSTTENFNYNYYSLDQIIIWTTVATLLAYVAGSVGLFYYRKNKYKNDEFKRVRPKKYLKNAVYGLLGTLMVVLAITFISLRWTLFNNSIVVFNPLDVYVIAFTVIAGIIAGYGIKVLVSSIRTNKERKRNIMLKIDEDVADDGTK